MQLKTDPLHEDAQAAEGRYGDDLSARLAEFDRDGTLVPDMRELWEILKDHVVDISRAFWEHYCQSPATRGQLSAAERSEEHTSELQSLMRISYAVFCLKKKTKTK